MNLSALGLSGATLPSAVPARRVPVNSGATSGGVPCRVGGRRPPGRVVAVGRARPRSRLLPARRAAGREGLTLLEHTLAGCGRPLSRPVADLSGRRPHAARRIRPGGHSLRWRRPATMAVACQLAHRPVSAAPRLRRATKWEPGEEEYSFVKVEGDGVHEIPVGPVHAGIIEPGHFRFQVVGEKVLRLEERLGYMHKGIEKRFEALPLAEGHRLAGRVSGDSTVAYAWAYAQALEAIADVTIPPRAAWLRALALERERIANHLGDLGYLGNDGGFAFGLAQFSRLKEDVLRTNLAAFGHGCMMDCDRAGRRRPRHHGGTRRCESPRNARHWNGEVRIAARHLRRARRLAGPVSHLRHRDARAGGAARAGRTGGTRQRPSARLALRLSGDAVRCARGARGSRADGDVAARVAVRFDEVAGVAASYPSDRRSHPGRRRPWRTPGSSRAQTRAGLCRRLARTGAGRARPAATRAPSVAAIPHDPSWQTGRCSSTR